MTERDEKKPVAEGEPPTDSPVLYQVSYGGDIERRCVA